MSREQEFHVSRRLNTENFTGERGVNSLAEKEQRFCEEIRAGQLAFICLMQLVQPPSEDLQKYQKTALIKYSLVRPPRLEISGGITIPDQTIILERGYRSFAALVEENLNLAYIIASRYHHDRLETEDFQGVALEGLMQAAATFKASKGKFSVYATSRVEKFIDRELKKISQAEEADREIEGRSMLGSGSFPEAKGVADVVEQVEKKWLYEELGGVINGLGELQRHLIWLRYFMRLSHTQVAELLGLPRGEEFSLHGRTMAKIRELLSKQDT